jgi:hypothetical protein
MNCKSINKGCNHFSSTIVEIISNNSNNLIGFKYGAKLKKNKYKKGRVRVDYAIDSSDAHIKTVDSLSHKLNSRGKRIIVRERQLPFRICAKMVVDYSDCEYPKIYTNRAYEFWSRLRGTCAFECPEEVLSNIVTVQLLSNGYTPIHCACVEKDGKGVIVVAPSNTGKTLSTWRLVSKFGFNFVCEDIGIIKDNNMFGCPYTATDVPDEIGVKQKKNFNLIKKLFFPVAAKQCLADFVKDEQIKLETPISKIYFLRIDNSQSQNILSKEQATDLMLKNNMLEFRYRDNSILLELWYRYGYPDMRSISDVEIKGLNLLISGTDDIREIVVSDPMEFAKIIADNEKY